jgi:twitching motility protein PilT
MGEVARFRVNVYVQRRGEAAVFRTIPTKILALEQLGMPPILRELCDKEKGLVLVTGPTGSGKSTTLAAMIDYLNDTFEGHILTVEDPIEFVHKSKKCLVSQRELGPHTMSFANALKAALREDPDIILVGEMRDLDTIQLALTAAETGHLVFGTLHTSSAPKTVDRIIDVFPPNQQAQIRSQFAESVEGVITQTLLKKKTGGRAAALEIMVGTNAVRNLIREAKLHQIPGIMQASQKDGMQTMDMALVDLVNKGLVTKAEAQSRSMTANLFGQPGVAAAPRAAGAA